MIQTPFHSGRLLLLNKPLGWTSFDLVNKVRYSIQRNYGLKRLGIKVGHAGTLDPLASGLMIVCTGSMTRQIDLFQGLQKEYEGTFFLGATTPSFDLEKDIDQTFPISHINEEKIYQVAQALTGFFEQAPPIFSAVMINGRRAYEFARKGENAPIKARTIEIKEFEIKDIRLPEVDFRIVCSKGTYIRSIARDFGSALESGAYLSRLCRTRIGQYSLSQAEEVYEGINLLRPNLSSQ